MEIFRNESDRYRAIFSLYEFNTLQSIEIRKQRRRRRVAKTHGGQSSAARDLLVEILTFCFMPNHIHLLVRQLKDEGITKFMRKAGTGYASYFNKKYERKGHLFQGRFRAVHIKNEEQLKNVFVYIHTNPLSLIEPRWREEGIRDLERAIEFLENDYRWSSYLDYRGKKNFPSLTQREFLLQIMGEEEGCQGLVEGWLRYKKELKDLGGVALE